MKYLAWSFAVIVFLAGCVVTSSQSGSARQKPLSDSVVARADRWRTDSLGCLNYRSLSLAKSIVYEVPEEYRNHDSLLVLLGPPNGHTQNEDFIFLTYLHHSICDSIEGDRPDEQWISFTFNSDDKKLREISKAAN